MRRTALPFVFLLAWATVALPPTPRSSRAETVAPNIVMILTDDQRWDQIADMPTVQSELVGKGTVFLNAFVHNSLCCPSRASYLTGQYSHTTGVWQNGGSYGGHTRFRPLEGSTIATWLHAAGFRTALVGKYMNGYSLKKGTTVPPGWDRWVAFAGEPGYYGYSISEDGVVSARGTDVTDYSTDVFAAYATDFVRSAPLEQPLFLWFAPNAPHYPHTPASRHLDALPDFVGIRPPNLNEADVSDKPAWVQALSSKGTGDAQRKKQAQALLAVDEAIAGILGALADTGRLANTLIVFASDNGLTHESHRWIGKEVAWEEAIRSPFVLRYDPLTGGAPATDDHLIVNVDVAPTFAAAAGVGAPGAEGMSLLPLLTDPSWREAFVLEHLSSGSTPPTYCGVRTTQYKYVEYSTGEEELYDLQIDPYELQSLHADPRFASLKAELHALMVSLCSPPPPGFTP